MSDSVNVLFSGRWAGRGIMVKEATHAYWTSKQRTGAKPAAGSLARLEEGVVSCRRHRRRFLYRDIDRRGQPNPRKDLAVVVPRCSRTAFGADSTSLVVTAFSPPDVDLSCNSDVNVAGLAAAPGPLDLPLIEPGELRAAKDPRTMAVAELGAIPWFRNLIQIGLSTPDNTPAFIMKIEPVVFERKSLKPAWGLEGAPNEMMVPVSQAPPDSVRPDP